MVQRGTDLSVVRRTTSRGDTLILIGELDLGTAAKLRFELRSFVQSIKTVGAIDVSAVGALDPLLLGELLGARLAAEERGVAIVVHCTDERVGAWLDASGVSRIVEVDRG
jgi:anti-anti-sigma factor